MKSLKCKIEFMASQAFVDIGRVTIKLLNNLSRISTESKLNLEIMQ